MYVDRNAKDHYFVVMFAGRIVTVVQIVEDVPKPARQFVHIQSVKKNAVSW